MDDSPTRSDTFIFGHTKASADGTAAHTFQVVRPANLKTGFWKILNFFIRHKHNAHKRTHATSSTPTVSSNPDLILDKKEEEEYGRLCLLTDELDESQSLHMEHEKGRDDSDEDKSKSEVSKGFFQKVNLEGLMKLFAELHRKKRARELAKKQDEESNSTESTQEQHKQPEQQEKSPQSDRVERFLKLSTTLALLKETTVSRASSASILETNAYQQTQTPTNSPRKNEIQRPAELDLEIDDDTLNLLESVRNKLTDLIAEENLSSLKTNCNDSTHYNNLCDDDWSTKVAANTLDYDTSCEDVSSLKNNSLHDLDEAFLRDAIDSEIVPPLIDCQDDEPTMFADAIQLDKNIDYVIANMTYNSGEFADQEDLKQNISCCDMGNPPNLGDFSYVEISPVGQSIVNTTSFEEAQSTDVYFDTVEEQNNLIDDVGEHQSVKEMIYNHISDTIDHMLVENDSQLYRTPNNTMFDSTIKYPPFQLNIEEANIHEQVREDDTIADTTELDNYAEETDLTTINENIELEQEEQDYENQEEFYDEEEEDIVEKDKTTDKRADKIRVDIVTSKDEQENVKSIREFVNIDDLIANYRDEHHCEDEQEISAVSMTDEVENIDVLEEEPQCRIVEILTEVEDTNSSAGELSTINQNVNLEETSAYNIDEVRSNVEEEERHELGSLKIEDVSSIDDAPQNEDLIDFNDSGINLDQQRPTSPYVETGDHQLTSILDQSNEELRDPLSTPQSAYAIAEEDIKTMIKELLFETEEIKETVIASSSHNIFEKSAICQEIIEEIVGNVVADVPPPSEPNAQQVTEVTYILDAVLEKVCNLMELKNHKVVSVNYCFVQTHMDKVKKHPESKIVRANKAFRTLYKLKSNCTQTGPRVTVVNLSPASQNRCFFRSEDKLTNRIRRSAALLMALYEEMRDYSYYSCTSNILCDLYESMCRNERYLPEISKRSLDITQPIFVMNAPIKSNEEKSTNNESTSSSCTTCQTIKYTPSITSLNNSDSEEDLPVSNILPNLKYTYCSQEEINSALELGLIEENVKANEGRNLGLDMPDCQTDSSDSLRTDVEINDTECFIRCADDCSAQLAK